MNEYSYRAIYLGNDNWVVRRFCTGCSGTLEIPGSMESRFVFSVHPDDPQLRSSDRKAIEEAVKRNDWRPIR